MGDRVTLWREIAGMCTCQRDKEIYSCNSESCSNHENQRFYCLACMAEGKHQHFPLVFIVDLISELDVKWKLLAEQFESSIR